MIYLLELCATLPYYLSMGIFIAWLMWQNNKLLEQIRRDHLAPAERAAEEAVSDEKDRARSLANSLAVLFILFLVIIYRHSIV
jgi:hypothetical protein